MWNGTKFVTNGLVRWIVFLRHYIRSQSFSTINLFINMFTYFPLPITRFDEIALIRHLVSQQEAIRLEFFWLHLTQRSGSISPKLTWSYDENLLDKIFLKDLLLTMTQSKGDKGVLNNNGKMEIQKFEYLENKKSFLDEIKSIFHNFWRDIIWWKNKNLMKMADTTFKYFAYEYKKATNFGKLYLLPKILQRLFKISGKPVMSNCGTASEHCSVLLDYLKKIMQKGWSYIKILNTSFRKSII